MVFGWWRSKIKNIKFHLSKNSCVVMRFKTESISELSILREELIDKNKYPYTGHGFTAGKKGRIGVPEFATKKGSKISIEDGTEIWKITRNGMQTLYAVFKNNTFKTISQWK